MLGSGSTRTGEEYSISSSSSEEDDVLAMEPRFVPAPRVAFETREDRRRGWQNSGTPRRNGQLRPLNPRGNSPRRYETGYRREPVSVLRPPGPNDSMSDETPICFRCYERGHYAPGCKLLASDYLTVVRNFSRLTPEEQARVPRTSFDEAILHVQKIAEDLSAKIDAKPNPSAEN